MQVPFTEWPAAISAANDERSRRQLLSDIGRWRLSHLTHLPSQREALWALAEIYRQLGELAAAESKADEALRLCQVPPLAAREVTRTVERLLERIRKVTSPPPPDARWGKALSAAAEGRFAEARSLAGRAKGPRGALFSVWTQLAEALTLEGEAQTAALRALEQDLGSRFQPGEPEEEGSTEVAGAPAARPARPSRPAQPDRTGTALAELMGQGVPADRDEMVAAMEAWLAEHAGSEDALAAAALRHHVTVEGTEAVAPWLASFTARALAGGEAPLTHTALAELKGAWALTLYQEPPFGMAITMLSSAEGQGRTLVALRRGLGRGGRAESAGWTLRTARNGVEGLVVFVPAGLLGDARDAGRLVDRVRSLSPRAVIVGDERELAAAASNKRIPLVQSGEPVAVWEALDALPLAPEAPTPGSREAKTLTRPARAAAATERPERADRPERAERPERAPRADRPDDSSILDGIRAAFESVEVVAAETWPSLLTGLARSWRAFLPLRQRLEADLDAALDARFAPFLRGLHEATPPGVRLAEATTWALRMAAAVPDGQTAALLASDTPAAARLGGPRIAGLAVAARELASGGWTMRRVLEGITRRESKDNAGLAALDGEVHGVWRLVVGKDDRRGEVWWIDAPSPGAVAALPLLLLDPRPRVILVPADADVALPPGTEVIRWTGAEGEALREAASGFAVGAEEDRT